jgi:hypothetical protein
LPTSGRAQINAGKEPGQHATPRPARLSLGGSALQPIQNSQPRLFGHRALPVPPTQLTSYVASAQQHRLPRTAARRGISVLARRCG